MQFTLIKRQLQYTLSSLKLEDLQKVVDNIHIEINQHDYSAIMYVPIRTKIKEYRYSDSDDAENDLSTLKDYLDDVIPYEEYNNEHECFCRENHLFSKKCKC